VAPIVADNPERTQFEISVDGEMVVRDYIERHGEYADLVPEDHREEFGL